MTKQEILNVINIATKYIASGKDAEKVVKATTELLMKEGVTSFQFFNFKSFDNDLRSNVIDIIYKLMCKVESLTHDKKTAAVRRAAVEHPASSEQIRRRQIEDQNMIFAMHHQF